MPNVLSIVLSTPVCPATPNISRPSITVHDTWRTIHHIQHCCIVSRAINRTHFIYHVFMVFNWEYNDCTVTYWFKRLLCGMLWLRSPNWTILFVVHKLLFCCIPSVHFMYAIKVPRNTEYIALWKNCLC